MKPTHNWQTWRAVDFGYHYPVCLWIQEAPSGQVRVVAELAGRKRFDWTTEEFADAILAKDATLGLVEQPLVTFCDPAGNNTTAQTGESEVAGLQGQGSGAGQREILDPRRLCAYLRRPGRARDPAARLAGLSLACRSPGGRGSGPPASRRLRRALRLLPCPRRFALLLRQPAAHPGRRLRGEPRRSVRLSLGDARGRRCDDCRTVTRGLLSSAAGRSGRAAAGRPELRGLAVGAAVLCDLGDRSVRIAQDAKRATDRNDPSPAFISRTWCPCRRSNSGR